MCLPFYDVIKLLPRHLLFLSLCCFFSSHCCRKWFIFIQCKCSMLCFVLWMCKNLYFLLSIKLILPPVNPLVSPKELEVGDTLYGMFPSKLMRFASALNPKGLVLTVGDTTKGINEYLKIYKEPLIRNSFKLFSTYLVEEPVGSQIAC